MTASGYFVNEYPNATIWNDRHVVLHDADCRQQGNAKEQDCRICLAMTRR